MSLLFVEALSMLIVFLVMLTQKGCLVWGVLVFHTIGGD